MWSLVLFCTSVLFIPEAEHAIYISVVEIEHKEGAKSEVRIKVFKDDLSDVIRNHGGKAILNLDNCPTSVTDLESYFNKTIEVQIDGQALTLKHESCSIEGDAYWFVFSSDSPSIWNSIIIKDTHFFELFPTQSNIVRIIDGNNERLVRLTKNSSQAQIKF